MWVLLIADISLLQVVITLTFLSNLLTDYNIDFSFKFAH